MTQRIRSHPDLRPPPPEQRAWVYLVLVAIGLLITQLIFPDSLPDTRLMRLAFGIEVGGLSGGLAGWGINGMLNRIQGKVRSPRPW
jgi:hypothetical protein